ncbi:MAG: LamG-like jellyroll fold domain-containing protein [Lentisphaeria bacterium]
MTAILKKTPLLSRAVTLSMLLFLLAATGLQAQARKWSILDWDDDGVVNANDGVLGADAYDPLKAPNKAGRALILSALQAAGGIELPEASRFQPNQSFILEFWYSPVADGTGKANGTFLEYQDATSHYTLSVLNSVVRLDFDGTLLTAPAELAPLTTLADDAVWYHIAVVCKDNGAGADVVLLVDGTDVAAQSIATLPTVTGASEARLGKDFLVGYLDEVRLWSAAYTDAFADLAAAVTSVADNRFNLANYPQPGLLAYYRFDDGGDFIEDFAHLPDFAAMQALHASTDHLDAAAVAAMEASFDNYCRYRLAAADSNVQIGHLYVDPANPAHL